MRHPLDDLFGTPTTHFSIKDLDGRTAVTYARQSIAELFGIKKQHGRSEVFAKGKGLIVIRRREYSDNERSGVSVEGREALISLDRRIVSGFADFQVVIAYDKPRFSRHYDPDFVPFVRRRWRLCGVLLLFVQSTNATSDSSSGEVMQDASENISGGKEHKLIRGRTGRGIREALIDGYWPYSHCPYGLTIERDAIALED